MTSGFCSVKDVLDVVAIPVGLAALAGAWPLIQGLYRRNRFHRMARRELAEMGPYPKAPMLGSWKKHGRTSFVHRAIVQNPSANLDFLLSLNPNFVYHLTQLWAAYDNDDSTQWLYHLGRLANWGYERSYQERIARVYDEWKDLIGRQYGEAVDGV